MTLLGVDQRRAGTAMLVFGVIGIALAGLIALTLVGTAVAARDLDERLTAEQAQLADTIDELATTTAAVVTSMENAAATLETSSTSILHARDVLDALATATTSLADGLEVSILGSQPFAGAAARFRAFSEQVAIFREDAAGISDRLTSNADDMSALAVRVESMETRLRDYAERIAESTRIGAIGTWIAVGVLLGGLLATWLAVAAGVCAWAGWRLRKG